MSALQCYYPSNLILIDSFDASFSFTCQFSLLIALLHCPRFLLLEEAEYAYARRKKIIPLMMEENYKPDGWLGILLGTKLWMNFKRDPYKGIQELLKEISIVTAGIC